MTAEEYRRKALEAQWRASQTSDARIKAEFALVAQHWVCLAEQIEWLERRFGSIVSTFG